MSTEDVKIEEGLPVEKVVEKTPVADEPQELSAIEQKALDMGWRPREDFDGDEETFIDAKEFVRRQPLFDKIEAGTKEVKQLRKALEQFKNHYSKVKETEYNRALAALKTQRKTALENNDGDRFELIDAEIKNVEKQAEEAREAQETPIVQDEPAVPAEFQQWKNRNRWYDSKRYMRTFADDFGTSLHQRGASTDEVLRQVEQEVRKKFPDEFTNPKKLAAPDVESSRQTPKGNSKKDDYPLTDEERSTMLSFERNKVMSRSEYIASLKEVDEAQGIKRN